MASGQIHLRASRVLQKLRAGEVAYSIKLNLGDSRVAEIAAMSGFDCIWNDMEHVPNDWSQIEHQITAAKLHHVDTVVRVARGSYSDYIRPLEMDATGIMIPHVMSLEDAKQVIHYTKFHPIGLRPLDGGNADGAYTNVDITEYMNHANKERFNILQIEDPEPLDDLEEIASLPGVDMIFFGPGDFSQAIGVPGQMDHPDLIDARKLIAQVANEKGIFAGTVGSLGNAQELISLGYRFINIGADVVGLSQYFQNIIGTLTEQAAQKSTSIYGEDSK